MPEQKTLSIEGIINGIGSPWGEGAEYEYSEENSGSHLNSDEDKQRLRDDINTLISQAVQKAKQEQLSKIVNEVRKLLAFEGVLSHSVEKALEELLTQPKE